MTMRNYFTPINRLLLALSCLQLGILTPAYALKTLDSCEKLKASNIEYSQCLDLAKEAIERELQTWVNNQIFSLEEQALTTGRQSALEMFKRSQKNFITYRENDCRWQYLAKSPSITAASTYKKCYIQLTRNRINELDMANH